VWAVRQGQVLNGARAAPFEAHSVDAEPLVAQRLFSQADGDAVLGEAHGGRELAVVGVARVQRDDRIQVPVFDPEAIQRQRIVGFI